MQTSVSRRIEWDMGHRVPDHASWCKNLHGHRYELEVELADRVVHEAGNPENGMVKDFGLLKQAMLRAIDSWDHSFMIYCHDPWLPILQQLDTKLTVVVFVPTAEEIAAHLFVKVQSFLNVVVKRVTVWETPSCKASVYR